MKLSQNHPTNDVSPLASSCRERDDPFSPPRAAFLRCLSRILLVASFWVAASAQAGAIESLKRFLANTTSFSADFSLSVRSESRRKETHSQGNLALQKPGKFRWEVNQPYPQLIVGDGEKIWIHDPDLAQVSIRRMGTAIGATPAALLVGSEATLKNFTLREAGTTEGLEWLEAAPKTQESGIARIQLGFTAKGAPAAMRLFDNFGQTTILHFRNARINPKIPAARFHFTPPPGTEILDETLVPNAPAAMVAH
ncbi:MAG: outer membrane lipoprotein chaperone LolA [Zoogloeaceae bacterium]|jgi:outer membrane lipoprotein carrier protein|nr:outer membrane lipoprotein chaperone LolA [Zoogloeaceae bacterium]